MNTAIIAVAVSLDVSTILVISGIVVGFLGTIASAYMTNRKLRSQKKLIRHLAHDSRVLQEIQHMQQIHGVESEEIEKFRKLISAKLHELNQKERSDIEAGLYQPSFIGRKRFVEKKLAHETAELQHASAH